MAEVPGRKEEQDGEGLWEVEGESSTSQIEEIGEKWENPVVEVLLESMEEGKIKNLLEEALREEAQCREWVEPGRRNLSQRSAAFVDKKVGKFMSEEP